MDNAITVASLVRGREKKTLTARVIRKWTYRGDNGQGDPLYVGMVLVDAQEDALYAEIPLEIMAEKEHLFDVGKVYAIAKFNVQNCRSSFKVIDGPLMIQLTKQTTVEVTRDCPSAIPEYAYSLTPFPSTVLVGRTFSKYTDAIGYVTEYTALESFVPRGREKVTHLRNLFIKDLSDNVLKITLWGDFAINFSVDSVYNEDAGNIVVCMVVGCAPRSEYNDNTKVYLSGCSPFAYYLNPQIQEAAPFYARFRNTPVHIKRPSQTATPSATPVADKPLSLMTIAALDSITDPFEFDNGKFKCAITISAIPEDYKWWYMSCTRHKKRANQQSDLTYKCPVCYQPATLPRYALNFTARDETGEARFFAYDDAAASLIGRGCQAVMNPLGQGLPQQLRNIINKKYVVCVDLSTSSVRQYVVRNVLERPARRSVHSTMAGSTSQSQASSDHLLQSPSKSMSALMLQTPQRQQPLLLEAGTRDVSPVEPEKSTPAQSGIACRSLFGRQSPPHTSDDGALSAAEEAIDDETDSPPARGKRRKSVTKGVARHGSKKTSSSDA